MADVAGRPVHTFEVVRIEHLTQHMIRVVLGGSGEGTGFDTFRPIDSTDAYVKLVFVDDAVDAGTLEQPLTLDSFAALDYAVRTYTVRHADTARGEITIDFLVHGDQGVAGPWAACATPGQRIFVMGPSGAYAPDPAADWHLLVGDEAALPAISAALEALPDNAIGQVFLEVAGPEDEIELAAPVGVGVTWIYRGGRADLIGDGSAGDHAPLIAAVTEAAWLPGQVQAFIHGEAQAVMHNLRPYIRKVRGVEAAWASSISGYWRRGRTEETFRQWKRELAEAEAK